MFGRKVKTQFDLLIPTSSSSSITNTKMSEQFNMKHGAVKRTFNVNERVYIKDFQQKKD